MGIFHRILIILLITPRVKMDENPREPMHPQRRLIETLMTNYNSRVGPVFHPEQQLQVNITLSVEFINNLEEKHSILHENIRIKCLWVDQL